MKSWAFLVAVTLWSWINAETSFSDNENLLTWSLQQYFMSGSCIVLGNEPKLVKFLSRYNVLSASMPAERLRDKTAKGFLRTNGKSMVIVRHTGLFSQLLQVDTLTRFTWVAFVKSLDDLKVVDMPVGCEFLAVRSNGSLLMVSQLHKVKIGQKPAIEEFGTMTSSGVINFPKPIVYARRRGDLRGVSLDLGLVTEEPCKTLHKQGVFEKTRCFHQDIFALMGTRMNYTKKVVICQEKKYAYVFPNGSLSGLFKMVVDKEVDASSGSFVVSTNRIGTLDFVWPTFVIKTVMYVQQSLTEDSWLAYLKPFNEFVWFAMLSWMALVAVMSYVFEQFTSEKKGFLNSIVFLVFQLLKVSQMLCNQAVSDVPLKSSSRILHMSALLAMVVLFPAYSGSIVSSLTVHKPVLPFTDLEGLFVNGRYKITTVNTSFIPYFFQFEYKSKKGWDGLKFLLSSHLLPTEERVAIDSICESSLAYMGFKEDVVNLRTYKCNIIEVPTPVFLQFLGLGLPRNSPYTELLARQLIYLKSVGIIAKMKSHFSPDVNIQIDRKRTTVSVTEIISGLAILAFGVFVSTFIVLIEMVSKANLKSSVWKLQIKDESRLYKYFDDYKHFHARRSRIFRKRNSNNKPFIIFY